jgi:hypothetical protein
MRALAKLLRASIALALLQCGVAPAQQAASVDRGTDALRIKYQGSLPALLEQRTDLNADAIRTFVRRGTWSMPPFRPTEVTESDIQDIAAYLRQSSGAASRGAR